MNLIELISCLQKVEEALWWFMEVHVKYWDFSQFPLSAIVPEKQADGERILILE